MHQDSFSSFNQSNHWFAALSFSWPSSFHKLPSDVGVVKNAQLLFCNITPRPFFPLLIEEVSYVRVLGRLRLKTNPAGRLLRTDLQLAASENAKCIRLVFEFQRVLPPCSSHLWTFPVPENKERKHACVRMPRNLQQEKKPCVWTFNNSQNTWVWLMFWKDRCAQSSGCFACRSSTAAAAKRYLKNKQ